MKYQFPNNSNAVALLGVILSFPAFSSDLARNELSRVSELSDDFNNVARVELKNAYESSATINQSHLFGSGNKALIRQSGYNNNANIDQIGGGNLSYIEQNGNDNYAAIYQAGWNNEGAIIQNGNQNRAVLSQTGIGLSETINQDGDGNMAFVIDKPNVNYSGFNINQSGNEQILIVNGMNKQITVH
ncbi:curlin subunit CsgB [Photobacterium sp. 2_MG-2023]|uniref:curlin subunit CsgB n=1 Tax=Photobacterium TaxID=657 RepID=UPI0026E32FF0|nr:MULTISPECIES: curlin subunit CsgB [Photobacterium]MDO6579999.1 curlin subunit CsgB [Photobacterium sp. 2_MG-2023]